MENQIKSILNIKNNVKSILFPSVMIASCSLISVSSSAALKGTSPKFEFAVNMQDGGLILKEESDSLLNVKRTYRSRSLDSGYFGTGWCSHLESKLIFKGQGLIQIQDCSQSRMQTFKISNSASSYINEEDPEDILLIRMGYYERRISGLEKARYNLKGELNQFYQSGQTTKIGRNPRNLPELLIVVLPHETKQIRIKWHPILDLINEIQMKNRSFFYEYSGLKLTQMIEKDLFLKSQNWVRYTYDDLDNLTTRLSSSEKEMPFLVEYNSQNDQVLKVFSTCEEIYKYEKKQKRQISTVRKICSHQSTVTKFDFITTDNSKSSTQVLVSQRRLALTGQVSLKEDGTL